MKSSANNTYTFQTRGRRTFFVILLGIMTIIGGLFCSVTNATAADTVSLIIKMASGLTAEEQTAVIARNGGVETSSVPALRLHVVTVATADQPLVQQDYQADAQVVSVEVNMTRKAEAIPTDANYGVQWSLPKIGWQTVYGTVAPTGSATVALLDTGVDSSHPDLAGNFVPGTSILNGSSGLTDSNGHGTYLAGIIAAVTDNGSGIAGVAYQNVKIMPVTVLGADGTGQDSDIIQGIVWAAEHGADVILMGFSNPNFSQNLQDAIDYAWSKGAVLVAATGNDGVSTPSFPAGARGVVGVSATDETDLLAAGSNFGLDTFLAAPGSNIYTTSLGDSYTYITGTSASSAIVAGVVGFMKAADPSLTNGVIVNRLAKSADAIGTAGDPNNLSMFGNGRVNMANALADTSTDSIQPDGAAPVGNGGPYVGPYTAAAANKVTGITVTQLTSAATSGSPTSANTYKIDLTLSGGASSGSTNLTVLSGLPPGAVATFNTTNPVTLPASTVNMSSTLTIKAGTASMGTYTIDIRASSSPNITKNISFIIKGNPNITKWPTASAINYGQTLTSSTLSGGEAITAGSFAFTTPDTSPNAGTADQSVTFTPTDINHYNTATGTASVNVTPTASTISWANPADITFGTALGATQLNATATPIGGSFVYSPAAGVSLSAGSQTLSVTYTPADPNYAPATKTVTINVTNAASTISWANPADITFGTALGATQLNATATPIGGSFVYSPAAGVSLSAGSQTLSVTYTPADPNYAPATKTVTINVTNAASTISWANPADITFGTALGATQLNATATPSGGSFVYSPAAGVSLSAGSQTLSVTYTPADPNYAPATKTVTINVTNAASTISWANPADITFGTALGATQLNATATPSGGSFVYSPAAGVSLSAGSQTLSVTYTPADPNYAPATKTVTINVTNAASTISWANPADITFGTALGATQLNATATPSGGSFVYSPAAGVSLSAGSQTLSVTYTPADPNYAPATKTVTISVTNAASTIAWANPADITFGTALGATQLNATATPSGGSFVYSPAAGVSLSAGSQTLSVTYTPADPNYAPATKTVTINVTNAASTISYTITANGTNGGTVANSVDASVITSTGSGSTLVPAGQNITYTFTPNPGHRVAYVTVGAVNKGAVSSYSFTNIQMNQTISAYFTPVTSTITATAGANGSISPTTSSYIGWGANQTCTITPAAGYHVATLTVDGTAETPATSYIFTNVTADHDISATFAANPTYTITASATGSGTITPMGATPILGGQNQTYTIASADGQRIDRVVVDGVNQGAISSYTFGNVQGDHSIEAYFVANSYTISASATGSGAITPSGDTTVAAGGSQSYTFTPNPGFKIAYVTVGAVNKGAVSSYSFTNVQMNQTISAYFTPITSTITATAGANGSISPGTSSIGWGANQTCTITPAAGYHVASLTVDSTPETPATSHTFTNVTADHSIAATFAANAAYTITAGTTGSGTITPMGATPILGGQNQTYTIAPAGQRIDKVLVDGVNKGAVTSYTFVNVQANHSIEAYFVANGYTITASAIGSGTITPSGDSTVAAGGSQSYTFTPNPGYKIAYVMVSGANKGAISSYTFTNVQANKTISVYFTPIKYKITVTAGANGSISPGTSSYIGWGVNQKYTITPKAGFHVDALTVDGVTQTPATSYIFTNVTADHNISATFAAN